MSLLIIFFLSLSSLFTTPASARQLPRRSLPQISAVSFSSSSSSSCPLNFSILQSLAQSSTKQLTECQYIRQGLRLVESEYLRLTNSFVPPLNSSESCWEAYQSLVDQYTPNFDIRSTCGFETAWISYGCMNISTRAQFESLVPKMAINDVVSNCNQSLENNSPCASCTTAISSLQASYLTGKTIGNLSDCTAYPSIYAAAFANIYGPTDPGTATCLFFLDFSDENSHNRRIKLIASLTGALGFVGLVSIFGGVHVLWRRKREEEQRLINKRRVIWRVGSGLDSIGGSTHLVKFTFDEIKQATRNFSRDNIIGRGGYGNVYKGLLPDGSEVAVKRFKNCSASGDANFAHETEVIASVRHVNLVALRGYCVATTPMEGHQRIIVCDLMRNGSLHDHLFGHYATEKVKLSWPIRRKIALGMARGLAYLHYGAQPAIIHRDIKASNILLDDSFEAKVADFGLAKFNPEGMSHLSTRVAGTVGYVAPEYALYGQLTERSDVFSFGVVLLELLSGKKAIISVDDGQPSVLTDWAWSLVREGNALGVIEDDMPEVGPPEVMEKYVLVAVLCSHPQLYARPTMDQVVKILETELPVPSIPERPIPLIAQIEDIERSASSSGSGLSTSAGYQPYGLANDSKEGKNTSKSGSSR
ncbi:Probable LRR receptor-like serine/threonine-protein kinase rkf3 [Ancistrocladus abbreviatus]